MRRPTTLGDLVEAASGSDVPVDELLRRLKVVSVRARLPELDGWVQHELNGYRDADDLPDYRGPFGVLVLGHFTGPYGQEIKNAPIPPIAYPEELRDGPLWRVSLVQGVAALEELAARNAPLELAWPPDMIPYTTHLQERGECSIEPMLSLVGAKQILDRSVVIGVLRAVRDRVLTLALRLEDESPDVGEPGGPRVGAQVGRDLQIIMNGGTANFALGSSGVTQEATGTRQQTNVDSVISLVREAGVAQDDANELRTALTEDAQDDTSAGTLGPKTQGWLRRWSGKAGGAITGATLGAVTKILLEHAIGS